MALEISGMTGFTGYILSDAKVLFGHNSENARIPRHIEVGLGDHPGLTGSHLSLNHKRPDASLRSATEFVAKASDDEVSVWQAAIPFSQMEAPFGGLTLAVEDASPDTCLAILCLAKRLRKMQLPPAWAEFASKWEQGYTPPFKSPDEMAGALLSALTHAEIGNVTKSGTVGSTDGHKILSEAVHYVAGLIDIGVDPWAVPRFLPESADRVLLDLHERAHACLQRERSFYGRIVASALKTQLSLPLEGSGRRVDVDAMFMTEVELTGVTKLLLRTDNSAPLGRGYTLWGLHRPGSEGSGFDMTVSLDPSSGCTLRELWIELEKMEELAWAQHASVHGQEYARPRTPVRAGIASFNEEPPIAVPSQQPWWEGRPLYTLIAAPRSVEVGGRTVPGSRLTWQDVKQAVWRLYAPAQDLQLRRMDKQEEASWRIMDEDAPRVRSVLADQRAGLFSVNLLPLPTAKGAPTRWTETISASLAAFVDVGRIEVDRLPAAQDYDVIESRGGIAMVTSRGVLLLDTAFADDFPVAELNRAARDVAVTVDCARTITEDINSRIRDLVTTAINRGRGTDKRNALKAIYAAKLLARQTWARSEHFEEDVLVRQFRERCEIRWNARGRLGTALEEIAEMEAMVVSSSEVRADSVLHAIAIVGFPVSIFANLLGDVLITNPVDRTVVDVVWPVAFVFLTASFVTLCMVWLFSAMYNRSWRINSNN